LIKALAAEHDEDWRSLHRAALVADRKRKWEQRRRRASGEIVGFSQEVGNNDALSGSEDLPIPEAVTCLWDAVKRALAANDHPSPRRIDRMATTAGLELSGATIEGWFKTWSIVPTWDKFDALIKALAAEHDEDWRSLHRAALVADRKRKSEQRRQSEQRRRELASQQHVLEQLESMAPGGFLDLRHLGLHEIPELVFTHKRASEIAVLELSQNRMTSLPVDRFKKLPLLQKLNLRMTLSASFQAQRSPNANS
jgi:hypothetical protein